jgi:hypothetical protein
VKQEHIVDCQFYLGFFAPSNSLSIDIGAMP